MKNHLSSRSRKSFFKSIEQRKLRIETLEKRHLLAASLGIDESFLEWESYGIERSIVPGELVVAFEHSESIEGFARFMQTIDLPNEASYEASIPSTLLTLQPESESNLVTLVQFEFDPNEDLQSLVSDFERLGEVAWASPNYQYSGDIFDFIPNDPSFSTQYHHTLMQNDVAWDTTLGDPSVIIAVTDDGVQLDHPDLAANIWVNDDPIDGIDNDGNGFIDDINGWDFVANDNDPSPNISSNDHGTHVAGILAGVTNNSVGIAGTAGGASIMPIRIAGNDGGFTSTILANTFAYAIDNGARIANTSYNINGFVGDPTFTAGLQYYYDNGGLHFNSAGNNNELNPARQAFHQTLLVASTTSTDTKSSFSNYGTGIDISAPGSSIFSTVTNSGYGFKSGTSMSAPNAAGAAALIWSANPTWSRDQVAAQLLATADSIESLNPTYQGSLGAGRVNTSNLSGPLSAPIVSKVDGLPADGSFILAAESPTDFSIAFNQIMDPASVNDASNFSLVEAGINGIFGDADDVTRPITLDSDYMIGTNELDFSIVGGPLSPGRYAFAVSANVTNPFGTSIDGDGNGVGGDAFLSTFNVIVPPLDPIEPLGSLAYRGDFSGSVLTAGQTQQYTVELDDGQSLTVVGVPDSTLTVAISVEAPSGSISSLAAASPGDDLVLGPVTSQVAGTYTITVSGANSTTGSFDLQVLVNTSVESETHGGASNDTLANAQSISASNTTLGFGNSDRLSVLGSFPGGPSQEIFSEDFESGVLGNSWTTSSSDQRGQIRASNEQTAASGTFALLMDVSTSGDPALNEAIWTVDLSGLNDVTLAFSHAEWSDETDALPETFTGSFNGDGVAVSDDGVNWFTVLSAPQTTNGIWTQETIDLVALANQTGMTLGAGFQIKFQQYDNFPLTTDGRGYDDIQILASVPQNDWYSFDVVGGETNSISLTKLSEGAAALGLFDSSGNQLATFNELDTGEQRIDQFEAPAGTYFVNVVGSAADYHLIIARQSDFVPEDSGPNSAFDISQSSTGVSFGRLGELSSSGIEPDDYSTGTVLNNVDPAVTLSSDLTGGSIFAATAAFNAPTGNLVFATTATGANGFSATNAFRADFTDPVAIVSIDAGSDDSSDTSQLQAYSSSGVLLDTVVSSPLASGNSETLAITRSTADIAYVLASGVAGDVSPLDNLQYSTRPDEDVFTLTAEAGDALTLETLTPGDGPLEPFNLVDVGIELFDPTGTLVASGTNAGNENISHVATQSGLYEVRAYAQQNEGDYVLRVTGATSPQPAFNASALSPADGAVLATTPTSVLLDFNDSVLLTSLQASDFKLNGVSASTVETLDGDSVVVEFPSIPGGANTLTIDAGDILDLQSTPLQAFSSTFTVDISPPQIVGSTVQEGDVLPNDAVSFSFDFSEPMSVGQFDESDFRLVGNRLGAIAPDSFNLVNSSSGATLTITYGILPEDAFTLTLDSGDGALEDLAGNDLDGEPLAFPLPPNSSGDGVAGGDFSLNFETDISSVVLDAPLRQLVPAGSQGYDQVVSGRFNAIGEVDVYQIDIDDNQLISIQLITDPSVTPAFTLADSNQVVANSRASAAGASVQSYRVTESEGGTYQISVSAADAGDYELRVILNSDFEEEGFGFGNNDSASFAQPIASINLPPAAASTIADATVSETAGTALLPISLSSQPQGTIYVELDSSDASEVAVLSPRLAFDSENWDQPQMVSVIGIDDLASDGDQISLVTASVDPVLESDQNISLTRGEFSVATLDNETYSPPDDQTATVIVTDPVGGSQPHENRQPSLAMNYIVAITGVFPSSFGPIEDSAHNGPFIAEQAEASEPFIGEVSVFAGSFAPRGWAFAHGQLLPINQNAALFSILGTTYGGDGQTTFALPDLRGRSAIGAGDAPGLTTRSPGDRIGASEVTLNEAQIPGHLHRLQPPFGALTTDGVGNVATHSNMMPSLGLSYIIATEGVFPSLSTPVADVESNEAFDPLIGEVRLFAGNFAPTGWTFADGRILPISPNSNLFSLIGTIYGGDGTTNFRVPDFRGRLAIGQGTGPGLSTRVLGSHSGSEVSTLFSSTLPSHSHNVPTLNTETITVGGSGSHNNVQPQLAINYAIALTGTFPSPTAPESADPFLGEIMMVGFNFAPRGWALANGQLLPISQNQSLFSLLGTQYGGDGVTTFALPDLRGRAIVGAGQGPGLPDYSVGQVFGSEEVSLTIAELPNHSHTIQIAEIDPSIRSVVGSLDASGSDEDWYSFAIDTDDVVTVSVTGQESNDFVVDLFDQSGGQQLAAGVPAANLSSVINDFVNLGEFHQFTVRVTGSEPGEYLLVVTVNAAFDTEANNEDADAQPLGTSQSAFGHVRSPSATTPSLPEAERGGGIDLNGLSDNRDSTNVPVAYETQDASVPLPFDPYQSFQVSTPEPITVSLPEDSEASALSGPIPVLSQFAGPDSTGFIPPDPIIAAGPEQVVTMVNTAIGIYDKSTGAELFFQNLNGPSGFFGSVGATTTVFDPWIFYDHETDRFMAVAIDIESSSVSNVFLAISTDSTPTNGDDWHKYKIDFSHDPTGTGLGTGIHFPDYEKMGVNSDAIFISGNYFPIEAGTGVYAGITAIEKAPLLSGGPANIVFEEHFSGFSVFPMQQYGSTTTQYFAESTGSGFQRIHAIDNVLGGSPTRQTFNLNVPAYNEPVNVPQLGGGTSADSISSRVMTGIYRDGSMWFAHGATDPAIGDGESVARWYEVNTNGFAAGGGLPTLVQAGNVDPGPGVHAWMPAINVDAEGNMGIGFAVGGPNQFYGAGFTGRLADDPLGDTVLPVTEYAIGQANYVGLDGSGRNRWGDYTGLALDPTDDATFWVYNEYASTGNRWATEIASFQLESPNDDDWYEFEATVGDSLTITTETPGGGPYLIENQLDPTIELYNSDGVQVASADSDGNETLNFNVTVSGIYRVRVFAAAGSEGEYFVSVAGASGTDSSPRVIDSDPDNGISLGAFPSTITLDFSEPILTSSVDLQDLLIGGLPATSVAQIDGDTFEFTINPAANVGDGSYSVVMASGAVLDLQGSAVDAYSGTFTLDTTGPRITSTTWNGGPLTTLAPGPLVFEAFLDEDLFQLGSARRGPFAPGPDDIELIDQDSGDLFTPSLVDYDSTLDKITIEFGDLPEARYTLTLKSGDGAIEDEVGNDLDGEPIGTGLDGTITGDGTPGGDYSIDFTVDFGTRPVQPFERLEPLGSLMSISALNEGIIDADGDTDTFSFTAAAGQVISVIAEDTSDSGGSIGVELVGLAPGASGVERVILSPTVIPLDGNYELRVTANQRLPYSISILNGFLSELEAVGGDSSDNNPLQINDSFVPLGDGRARFSIVGHSKSLGVASQPVLFGIDAANNQIVELDTSDGSIRRSFTVPNGFAGALSGLSGAENGSTLIFQDSSFPTNLYRVDPTNGNVLSVEQMLDIGSGGRGGLSFEDSAIFAIDVNGPIDRQDGFSGSVSDHVGLVSPDFPGALGGDDNGRHFFVDAGTIVEFDANVANTIINSFSAPQGSTIGGLAFDGTVLYASDWNTDSVYSLDPNTGAILSQLPVGRDLSGLGVVSRSPTSTGDAIINGSFETGDFNGWTTAVSGSPFRPWAVSGAGQGGGFSLSLTDPQDGDFVAWNGFDGSGPLDFTMNQVVTVPNAGELSFQYRAQWDFTLGSNANIGRDFFVEILDPNSNALLSTVFSFNTGTQSVNPTGDTGWQTEIIDLSAFSGQTVALQFREFIPETLTGPGQIEFDAISLTSAAPLVPDVDQYDLDLTGQSGQSIDVVLAGHNGADFRGETLELIAPDGVTVLAAGTIPIGPNENYDLSIRDFTVPADGVFSIRFSSLVSGEYGLSVTTSMVFDSEPNNSDIFPLRSLDTHDAALGYLEAPGTTVGDLIDLYEFNAQAGDVFTFSTETPFDSTASSSPNNLDVSLTVLEPIASFVVASDSDSAPDGKNAIVTFTARSSGTYSLRVEAEQGLGEYVVKKSSPQLISITDVIVSSSSWDSSFIDIVDGGGPGAGNGLGLSLPGSNQTRNLPWLTGIDTLFIEFDDDVSNGFSKTNLSLIGNESDHLAEALISFDSNTNIGTISLATPVTRDALILTVFDSIASSFDGEWVDSVSLLSGNGTPGGRFDFRIDVLAGDVNDDNAVSLTGDVLPTYQQNTLLPTTLNESYFDVSADGAVSLTGDVLGIYGKNTDLLPDPPQPPSQPLAPQSLESIDQVMETYGLPDEDDQELALMVSDESQVSARIGQQESEEMR